MAIIQVTENNFEATIGEGVVLLDFWASWCAPCCAFGPVFEAAAARHPKAVFGKIDVEAEPGLAEVFQVSAIPTLAALRDGVLLASRPGALSAAALDDFVHRVQALDMAEVRKDIVDQKTAAAQVATEGVA